MQHGPPTKAEAKAQSQRDKAANRKAQNKLIGKVNHAPKKGKNKDKSVLFEVPTQRRVAAEQAGTRQQHISEDEFVCTIYGGIGAALGPGAAGGSSVQNIVIQPALAVNGAAGGGFATWGRQVAALYEAYSVEKMEFYYRPLVSAFSPQGTSGKVIIGVNYESTEALPSTVAQAESNDPHVDGMAYEKFTLPLDPRRLTVTPKYTRVAGVPGSDYKMYDAGRLFVVATGMVSGSDTVAIGELRVRYALRLHNPRLPTPITQPNIGLAAFANSSAQSLTNNVPAVILMADILSLSPYVLPGHGLGVQNVIGITPSATGVFAISAFAYAISWSLTVTHGASVGTQLLTYVEVQNAVGTWVTYGTVPFQNVIGPTAGAFSLTNSVMVDGTQQIGQPGQIVAFRCSAISYFPSSTSTVISFASSMTAQLIS